MTSFSSSADYKKIESNFNKTGCSRPNCPYGPTFNGNRCALNLHDAIIRSGYRMGTIGNVWQGWPLCPHERIRAAQGMRDLIISKLGEPNNKGWNNKPNYKGIVWFSGENFTDATGHIDLWNGTDAVHKGYKDTNEVWFWKLS